MTYYIIVVLQRNCTAGLRYNYVCLFFQIYIYNIYTALTIHDMYEQHYPSLNRS